MNILLDTNIFIQFEDYKILDESYTNLFNILSKYQYRLYIHPASLEDIKKDKDDSRREVSLSKINKYTILDKSILPTEEDIKKLGLKQTKDNDRIDNLILFSLYKDNVNLLLTEDSNLIKKARKIGLDHRVMYVQQALNTFKQLHMQHLVSFPDMLKKYVYELDGDDEIFDSLKNNYIEFKTWFKKISQDRRECWIHSFSGDKKLGGILIYKEEDTPVVTSDNIGLPGKTLKISTLKIADHMQGHKLGELFIKTVFNYANKNHYDYVYLTARSDNQSYLLNLLEDFGFVNYGKCTKKRDDVYVKKMSLRGEAQGTADVLDFHRRYSPSIRCSGGVNKYIVPIQPYYHNILFPEIEDNRRLFYTHASAGNTIKKAYLSHSKIKNMCRGDLILFYRSKDKKSITTLGIVEKIFISKELDTILEEVAKRTVFSYEEIKKMAEKETHIILFRLVEHFPAPYITRDWLKEEKIYKNCQSICKVENDVFSRILKKGKLNHCL